MLKTVISPRGARDKHSENSKARPFSSQVHDNWADTNTSRLACAVSQRPTPTCRWWNNSYVKTAAGELWPVDARRIMAEAVRETRFD
jgi:hypothetical protein